MKAAWIRIIIASSLLVMLTGAFVIVPLFDQSEFRGSFSAYENGWQGLSEVRKLVDAEDGLSARNVGSSPLVLKDVDPAGSVLVIAGMDRPYNAPEKEAIDAFMKQGGTVLLLDDYGYGDTVSEDYGIHYLKRPLRDKAFERNQSFVRVVAFVDEQSYPVLANGPSALETPNEEDADVIKVIILTGSDSFLDLNNNGDVDVVDAQGPFAVGLRRDVGEGHIVVISDSGFLNNDMIDRQSNFDFVKALLYEALPEGGLVLFDESRRDTTGFEVPVYATQKSLLSLFRAIPFTGVLFTVGFLALAGTVLTRLKGREPWQHVFSPGRFVAPPHRPDDETLLRGILEKKAAMDTAADPLVASALSNEGRTNRDDMETLMKHIASELHIDMPEPGEELEDDEPEIPEPTNAPSSSNKPLPA